MTQVDRAVSVKDLQRKDNLVFNSLALWLGNRPEFEIFDPVVGAYAVPVVDYFVDVQSTTKVDGHHQSVLTDFRLPSTEMSQFEWYRNPFVTVGYVDETLCGPDRYVRFAVAASSGHGTGPWLRLD